MQKKVPMRTCIGCRRVREKKDLIRIVRTPEGEFHLDPGGRANGRGAYLCRNPECLELAFRRKALHRAFSGEVSGEEVRKVRTELEEFLRTDSRTAEAEARNEASGEGTAI